MRGDTGRTLRGDTTHTLAGGANETQRGDAWAKQFKYTNLQTEGAMNFKYLPFPAALFSSLVIGLTNYHLVDVVVIGSLCANWIQKCSIGHYI